MKIYFSILFILFLLNSYGQVNTEIGDNFSNISMINRAEFFDNSSLKLTIDQVSKQDFKIVEKQQLGYSNGKNVWLRFRLTNTSNSVKHLFISFERFTISNFSLYKEKKYKGEYIPTPMFRTQS